MIEFIKKKSDVELRNIEITRSFSFSHLSWRKSELEARPCAFIQISISILSWFYPNSIIHSSNILRILWPSQNIWTHPNPDLLFQNLNLSEFYLTFSVFHSDKIGQSRDEIWIKGHGLAIGTFKTYFLEVHKRSCINLFWNVCLQKKSSKMQQGTDFQHIVNLKMQ